MDNVSSGSGVDTASQSQTDMNEIEARELSSEITNIFNTNKSKMHDLFESQKSIINRLAKQRQHANDIIIGLNEIETDIWSTVSQAQKLDHKVQSSNDDRGDAQQDIGQMISQSKSCKDQQTNFGKNIEDLTFDLLQCNKRMDSLVIDRSRGGSTGPSRTDKARQAAACCELLHFFFSLRRKDVISKQQHVMLKEFLIDLVPRNSAEYGHGNTAARADKDTSDNVNKDLDTRKEFSWDSLYELRRKQKYNRPLASSREQRKRHYCTSPEQANDDEYDELIPIDTTSGPDEYELSADNQDSDSNDLPD